GMLMATPAGLALLLVEIADFIFAVDSIPAVLAISTDPFILFTANAFAILGLRALYFAMAGLLPRFRYLRHGLALLLVLIGAKMLLAGLWPIPVGVALATTLAVLIGAIGLSLVAPREPLTAAPSDHQSQERAMTGKGRPAAAPRPEIDEAIEECIVSRRNFYLGLWAGRQLDLPEEELR